MAFLEWRWRSKNNWTPASYTANEVSPIANVAAGDINPGICITRTRVVFNGSGTAAIIVIGDGDTANGDLADGDMDETTTGLYRGQGAYWNGTGGPKLYTVADAIDITFTANTAGTRTTGTIDAHVVIAPSAF